MALADTEASKLADMAAALRPEWNARTTRAFLVAKYRNRSFGDLVLALAAICADETSRSPGVLELDWPWAVAAAGRRRGDFIPRVGPATGIARCGKPGHEHEEAHACRLCRAEALDAGTSPASERDWSADGADRKPIHAMLRVRSADVLCGIQRSPGLWIQLGSDPASVLRRTTCSGCRAALDALIERGNVAPSGGAVIRDDDGGHYMLDPPAFRPPHPGVFVVMRSGLVNVNPDGDPSRLVAVSTGDTVTMPEPATPETVDVR